jgi:hypothetical protein
MQRAFIIRPFGTKTDRAGKEINFEHIHHELIAPALDAAGLRGGTTGEIIDAGNIREDMFGLIIEADLIVCDITVHNANVFYELGIRHALRKKGTVLIKGAPVDDSTPFDILTDRYLEYSIDDPGKKKSELADVIRATLVSSRETDSPLFKMLPTLPEVDPAAVQVVPTDFTDEVERATAAKAAGWLRLLASEVTGLRFQWPALRLIGRAQWKLEDFDGARRTWERVRENDFDDLAANLALANLYERQYRREKALERLEASNQAIARVLTNKRTTAGQRAEALALRGRNQKTMWRVSFGILPDLGERRQRATNRSLLKAYEAYREAFLVDLNHYWSGLAALQMGMVALSLSQDEAWPDAFEDDDQAAACTRQLNRQVEALRSVVSQAVEAALKHLPAGDANRTWAEISAADLSFLVENRSPRVVKTYLDAIPRNDTFAWNATKGQLQLFASLGIRADLANDVIREIERQVEFSRSGPDLHVIVFAGHRIDEPDRAEPRFPVAAESHARELIRNALRERQVSDARLKVLASAAPGSDIICHEACQELGIDSTICLPMPMDLFSKLVFNDLDVWRRRFLTLVEKNQSPLQLSDQAGLPRWLQGMDNNPWERGNRWVLEMAQTSGARTMTLIALWNGKETGDGPGGTAHMVQIARAAGLVDVVSLDAGQLLTGFAVEPVAIDARGA